MDYMVIERSEEIRKAPEEKFQALWDWIDGADEEVWNDEENN